MELRFSGPRRALVATSRLGCRGVLTCRQGSPRHRNRDVATHSREYYALCCLLFRDPGDSRLPQSRLRDTKQTSRGKFDRLPHAAAEFTLCVLDGNGLRDHLPARPTLTPRIRFLSSGSCFCSTLLSDPASRRRPCASLILHLHQVGRRTCPPKLSNMLGTHRHGGDGRPSAPATPPYLRVRIRRVAALRQTTPQPGRPGRSR